jgi:ComF family protein
MNALLHGLLDLLYPPRCEACGRLRRASFCEECTAAVALVAPPVCARCGDGFDPAAAAAPICEDCRRRPPPFARARSAAYYEGPLVQAIWRFKYGCQMVLAKPLGALMAAALEAGAGADLEAAGMDVLCAVPLHPSRLRERGFNQSQFLAEEVAAALGKPLRPLLVRTRATPPQVDLPARSRSANVRGAFAVSSVEAVAGQRVLLVDDLFTTGATLAECARVLGAAGAAEVRVFTLARAMPAWRRVAAEARQAAGAAGVPP